MFSLQDQDYHLLACLNRHPHLKGRIAALLSLVEDAGGGLKKADEAERRVIEELRQLGNEALHSWANHRIKGVGDPLRSGATAIRGSGQKNSTGTRHLGELR